MSQQDKILEHVISIKERVGGINQHLETLNSKVATNVLNIEKNRSKIEKTNITIAKWAGAATIVLFIVNLLLIPYLLDAVRALEQGLGTIEDIDNGMKLGCGHPMGPITLLDFVGIDTVYHIANIMFDEYREKKYAPPPLLKKMYLAEYFGKKSGKGFYDYTVDPPRVNKELII